jgi:hypothetical protein
MRKNIKDKNAFTLIEILIIAPFLILGVLLSQSFGAKFGLLGYLFGFLTGLLCYFPVIGVVGLFRALLVEGIPFVPICKRNQCKEEDYELQKIELNDEIGFCHHCKCGDKYLKRGRHFFEIGKDNAQKEYLVWIPFKGWEKDM